MKTKERPNIEEFSENLENLFERIHAEVIDIVYLKYKQDFVDYESRTHKLGWFKEEVKRQLHKALKSTSTK